MQFGFRASDGSEVTIDAIDGLISYVEEIVKRFSTITTPVLIHLLLPSDQVKSLAYPLLHDLRWFVRVR